jgi:predicted ATPase/class 3 adenylate cyclase
VGDRPSGTVTFLFTDIEGSTSLWELAPGAMREALVIHDAAVRSAIDANGGYVFATGGDGFAAAFAKAADAVIAGITAQRVLAMSRWPEGAALRVRVGIHTGEAWERDDDYFGTAVNTAARLMGAAGAGQVLCTQVTAALVIGRPEWEMLDLGDHELRGLSTPVRVFGVAAEGIDRPSIAATRKVGNLPHPPTEFIGRSEDFQRLAARVRPRRLVTLTGTGGVGKTRLAVEVAWAVAPEYADGTWLVDLASVIDPELVAVTVAQTMAVRFGENRPPLDALVDAMRDRHGLLVLDNCEHLLDACGAVSETLLAECPRMALVATSREPLGIAGEQVWRVASLDPAGDAVELFLDRAVAADASFSPADHDLAVIEQICTRLDGIPLAIELAAARLRTLGAAGLHARLDDRFALLRRGHRGGLERHQTLRAAVGWSYQLLTPEETSVFDRCAVFADGFDLDAAVAVCGDGLDELEIIDRLAALVDKSMLAAVPDDRGPRYRMLETLRQFAEERLISDEALEGAAERHLHYFAGLAASTATIYESAAMPRGRAIFTSEWGNLRAALTWAVERNDVAAATVLVEASAMFGLNAMRYEHEDWAQSVLALVNTGESPSLCGIVAYWKVCRGDYEQAVALAQGGGSSYWSHLAAHMALYSLGDLEGADAEATALVAATVGSPTYRRMTAAVMVAQAAFGKGEGFSDACADVLRLAAEVDNVAARSFACGHRSMSAMVSGDYPAAIELMGQAVDHAREGGLVMLEGGWMSGIAFLLSALPFEDVGSSESFAQLLRHSAAIGDGFSTWTGLEALAIHLAKTGRVEQAAVIFGHLDYNNRHTADMVALRAPADAAVGALPDASGLKGRGAAMSRDDAVAYALAVLDRQVGA